MGNDYLTFQKELIYVVHTWQSCGECLKVYV